MKNLISMTDFVLNGQQTADYIKLYDRCFKYANFLKQPLELWMFVPCDKNKNPLSNSCGIMPTNGSVGDFESVKEYQQAKERCLFEGFGINEFGNRIINNKDETIYVKGFNSKSKNWIKNIQENTIEDLVKYKPLLTATAQKGIGL